MIILSGNLYITIQYLFSGAIFPIWRCLPRGDKVAPGTFVISAKRLIRISKKTFLPRHLQVSSAGNRTSMISSTKGSLLHMRDRQSCGHLISEVEINKGGRRREPHRRDLRVATLLLSGVVKIY